MSVPSVTLLLAGTRVFKTACSTVHCTNGQVNVHYTSKDVSLPVTVHACGMYLDMFHKADVHHGCHCDNLTRVYADI